MFEGVITLLAFFLPCIQCGSCYLIGFFSFSKVQQGFPHHPLMRKPNGSIPITICTIIRSRLVYCRDSYFCPHFVRRKYMVYHPACLLFRGDVCNKWAYSVQSLIKVRTIFISIDTFRFAIFVMYYISEITGFLIP